MKRAKENLTVSTCRALGWSYAGSIVRLILVFGVNILLTRLLGPKPFGVLAVAMLFFGLGNLLAGMGVTTALIQKQILDPRDIRFCFTAQMIVGTIVAALLFWSAPAFSAFFRQQELKVVLRVLAPLFLFQSFGTTSTALLNRRQNTRGIQISSIISYFVAFLGFGVPMALFGWGVWSLVTAYLVQSLVNCTLVYAQERHSLLPSLQRGDLPALRFGMVTLGSNLSNWLISNLDNTFVGRVAGPFTLGLYSRAFTLASLPAEQIVINLLQVLLPSFSRVQTETDRLRRVYLAAVGSVGLVLLPPFCAMAAVPDAVVLGLYGDKWAGAIRLFQPLALAIPLNALMALSGPLLTSRGKPQIELRFQFGVMLAAVCVYWLCVHRSVLWLSWGVLLIYAVRFALLTNAARLEINLQWSTIARSLQPAIALAGAAAIAAALANAAVPSLSPSLRLATVIAGSAVPTLLILVYARRIMIQPILRNVPQLESILRTRFVKTPPIALGSL